ncbi:MAG: DUF1592 domain-containing protein [Myxococcota bacterium]
MHRIALALLLAACGKGGDDVLVPCEACDTIGPSTRFARLTHTQYENTLRDLLEAEERPGVAGSFIGDVLSEGGFDNDGDQLQVGGDLWLDYQRAAEVLAGRVVAEPSLYAAVVPEDPRGGVAGVDYDAQFEGEGPDATGSVGRAVSTAWLLWSNGDLTVDVTLDEPGNYRLSTRVWADQAGPDLARMRLAVDGASVFEGDVSAANAASAEVVSADVPLSAGSHRLTVSFLNDYYDSGNGADRNLYVDWVGLAGAAPAYEGPLPGVDEAEDWIARFGSRVHRRPLTEAQVAQYVSLYEAGAQLEFTEDPFQDGVYTVLGAMFQSPGLLYRTELSQDQDDAGRIPLDSWDLASKLSFSLTHSMPDPELWAAAEDGSLVEDAVYDAQVERLLGSPAAAEVVDHFHAQLLNLDAYDNIYKDPRAYPQWNPAMNDAMKVEALRFTGSVVWDEETVYDFFTAPRTYVNRDLAPLYGLTVDSETFVQVDLDAAQRAGVLTLSGFLASQAHASEIDTIHRGAFMNLRLLCSRLPPPPNVVPPLPEPVAGQSNRERVNAHTGPGTCGASCHAETINPVGFAFENYDALGQWQTTDADKPIDASGTFRFTNEDRSWTTPVEFAELVAGSSNAHECLTRNWMQYLHGRNTSDQDRIIVDGLAESSRTQDVAIRSLIRSMVTADAFRYRNPEVEP